jgi:hypothetical protein
MRGLWKIGNPCSLSLAQQVSFCASFGRRWNNDFSLFLPVFQDSSFIYRILIPLNLSHIHAHAHVHAHTHTHTHIYHLPMLLFIWSLFVMTWKPSTLGHTPSFKDKDSPSAATKKSPRVSQLHPNPLPVTGERYVEQSQVSWENESSTEKLKKVMLTGAGGLIRKS